MNSRMIAIIKALMCRDILSFRPFKATVNVRRDMESTIACLLGAYNHTALASWILAGWTTVVR